MRSRALFLALGVFVLASSTALAAPKSRRTAKPSDPPAATIVREPRGPSERVRRILARLTQFALIENGDEMSPPKP